MSRTSRPDGQIVVVLDGRGLTPATVAAVARDGVRVSVADAAGKRVARDRAIVDDAVARRLPVYGLTTGLGPRVTYTLPEGELAQFSVRTVRGRANAVGPPLPTDVVRSALLVRCNGIAHGGSGASPRVLDLLVEMLNRRVHPVVPQTGSIGASDLNQMAHIGLAVIGEGEAELDGARLPAAGALERAGLEPARLGPGDGLALCNSSAIASGAAALAYHDARQLLAAAQVVAALSFEGFRANTTPLDPRAQAAHPVPGQQACADQLRDLLAGGLLLDPANARRLQDPLSFRTVPHVHGALRAALRLLTEPVDAELNGAGDNPLVVADDGVILSTGNFNTTQLALALDAVALALFQTASISAQRTHRLLSSLLTDLPENLSRYGPERSGYAPLIKTAQALLAELRHLASPLSTDPRFGASLVEDDSSGAPTAARRDARMLELVRHVLAIETLVAAQAVDLAAPGSVGRGPAALHRATRARVPPLDDDRPSGADVEMLARDVFTARALDSLLDESGIGATWRVGAVEGW